MKAHLRVCVCIFFLLGMNVEFLQADTHSGGVYFSAGGFDLNNDGQPDVIDTDDNGEPDSLAVEWPAGSNTYWEGYLGGIGMTSAGAYYPDAARIITDDGLGILIGNGSYEKPQSGSALAYRSVLYATSGSNALRAWYTNAIQAFTPKLANILEAEERFREALRANPYYTDALNGFLEAYYARAEGFMLIGNDYMARAYRHKFERNPGETRSIVELEMESLDAAMISYETGFREFMKLFNEEYVGMDQERKPHLDMDAQWLFFNRRFENPNGPGLVSFEALRGQKNVVGVSTLAFNDAGIDMSVTFLSKSIMPLFERNNHQRIPLHCKIYHTIFGLLYVYVHTSIHPNHYLCIPTLIKA